MDWRKKGLARVNGKNLSGRGRNLSAIESSLWICSGGGTQEARGQEAGAKERNEESLASVECMTLSSFVICYFGFHNHPLQSVGWDSHLHFLFFLFVFKNIYLAIRILSCSLDILSWGMWDLVPGPGIEPRPSAFWAQSLSHWKHQGIAYIFIF